LGGLARKGYCAGQKRWFYGVREHLIFTPTGRIAFVLSMPGNQHDVQGLYALLQTSFKGLLLADNAYWPTEEKRAELKSNGIRVVAETRSNWEFQYKPEDAEWLRETRGRVERCIGLFDAQFNAEKTRCRSAKHYLARRWTKVLSHNCSRHINQKRDLPKESVAHFRLAA